jgi:hypothetical protein
VRKSLGEGGGRGGRRGRKGREGGERGEGCTCVRACTRRLTCPLLPNVNGSAWPVHIAGAEERGGKWLDRTGRARRGLGPAKNKQTLRLKIQGKVCILASKKDTHSS